MVGSPANGRTSVGTPVAHRDVYRPNNDPLRGDPLLSVIQVRPARSAGYRIWSDLAARDLDRVPSCRICCPPGPTVVGKPRRRRALIQGSRRGSSGCASAGTGRLGQVARDFDLTKTAAPRLARVMRRELLAATQREENRRADTGSSGFRRAPRPEQAALGQAGRLTDPPVRPQGSHEAAEEDHHPGLGGRQGGPDPPGLRCGRLEAQHPLVRRHHLHRHLGGLASPLGYGHRHRLPAGRRLRPRDHLHTELISDACPTRSPLVPLSRA